MASGKLAPQVANRGFALWCVENDWDARVRIHASVSVARDLERRGVIDGYIDDHSSLMESNVSCAAIQYRSIFTAIAVVVLVAGCSQFTTLVTNPIASSTPAASEASSYPVCMKEGNSCATPGSKCCAGLVCVGAQNGFCTTKQ